MSLLPNKIDIKNTEDWIDSLGLKSIRECNHVQRLKRIRFLGTMQYITELKHFYNRYQHSLTVAKIAFEMGSRIGLPEKEKIVLVLMALLHDIGHMPFSHASEIFFRKTWGKYHAAHSSRLAHHLVKFLRVTSQNKLADLVETATFYLSERSRNSKDEFDSISYEIFHGVISADTLDGIARAAVSIGIECPDPELIISGLLRNKNSIQIQDDTLPIVIEFLKLKNHVYNDYVYSTSGLSAEAMLTRALELTFTDSTDKNEFLSLDDQDALDKIYSNLKPRLLLDILENRELHVSLREVAPDKYKLAVGLIKNANNDLLFKAELEKIIAEHLNVSKDYVITHNTIRLSFVDTLFKQQFLISSPISLKEISSEFKTSKSFDTALDIFIPAMNIDDISHITIPNTYNLVSTNNNSDIVVNSTVDKHRGAYMTPSSVAEYIANTIINDKNVSVFDPSAGDGVFLKATFNRKTALGETAEGAFSQIYGVESDTFSWEKCLLNSKDNKNIQNVDFFDFAEKLINNKEKPFDVVIGNPPYIRGHLFQKSEKDKALKLCEDIGITLSKRASSWAPYVVVAASLLRDDGKLGMLLPQELLTTDYAVPVREFLQKRFKNILFVTFKTPIFTDAQQDVLLFIGSNDGDEAMSCLGLEDVKHLNDTSNLVTINTENVRWLNDKLTHILVDNRVLAIYDKLIEQNKLITFDDIAAVKIGHVTGNNDFFLLSESEVKKYSIHEHWLIPVVTRAIDILGAFLEVEDYQKVIQEQRKCYMLYIPSGTVVSSDRALLSYLDSGKRQGVDQKYKCRNRWPWYTIPRQNTPDAFLTYMSGGNVRLVVNKAKVDSTNTIHNVYFKENVSHELVSSYVASFYSSVTGLSAELVGRSYGGGVLKLEINETRSLLLPNLANVSPNIISNLSRELRNIDHHLKAGNLDICNNIDTMVMNDILELTQEEIKLIKNERIKLAKRRLKI